MLGEKPEALGDGKIDDRAWKGYQAYLSRIRPVDRADFYQRLRERHGCTTVRALAQITGEDWSRVARVLKLLELPAPILDYLRTHDSPQLATQFSERSLRKLLLLKNPKRIWNGFQEILNKLSGESVTA